MSDCINCYIQNVAYLLIHPGEFSEVFFSQGACGDQDAIQTRWNGHPEAKRETLSEQSCTLVWKCMGRKEINNGSQRNNRHVTLSLRKSIQIFKLNILVSTYLNEPIDLSVSIKALILTARLTFQILREHLPSRTFFFFLIYYILRI